MLTLTRESDGSVHTIAITTIDGDTRTPWTEGQIAALGIVLPATDAAIADEGALYLELRARLAAAGFTAGQYSEQYGAVNAHRIEAIRAQP